MKKNILFLALLFISSGLFAQKFAYVDTEYILSNIPNYEAAQSQLQEFSEKWEKEVNEIYANVEDMYKTYRAEMVLLTDEQKRKREDEITQKENDARALQMKYFGREGLLFKKRQELIKPIQDEVFDAIKELAEEGSFAVIFDISGSVSMLYTDPKYDRSDEVLEKLGYKN